jgi:fatty-acyl-CoA synthase
VLASCANVVQIHELTARDVTYVQLPLYHTAGLHLQLTASLYAGATIVIGGSEWNAELIAQCLRQSKATTAFLLPQQWLELADQTTDPLPLRLPITGGSPLSPGDVDRIASAFSSAPGFGMGMTEVGPQMCYCPPAEVRELNGALGYPTPWYELKVAADERMATLAAGELCARGPTLFDGYWDGERASPNAFDPEGWFHTGDIVEHRNGLVRIVDRSKDIIRTGGETVFSQEVERVLSEHAKVADVAVIGTRHPRWGEGVTAVVVPTDHADPPTLSALQQLCRGRLAGYKKPVALHVVAELPRNATGKVLKHQLRSKLTGVSVTEAVQRGA